MARSVLSPDTSEALRMLAASIKTHRLRRRWSIDELARRVGVSHPTIIKVERADPTVAIGTMFEAATLVGVTLFDADSVVRTRQRWNSPVAPVSRSPRSNSRPRRVGLPSSSTDLTERPPVIVAAWCLR